jgi:hypothetical protein
VTCLIPFKAPEYELSGSVPPQSTASNVTTALIVPAFIGTLVMALIGVLISRKVEKSIASSSVA